MSARHVGWHNWLIHSAIGPRLRSRAERYARGRLLDIGCGAKPYREMFARHVSEHVGLDHPASRHGRGEVDLEATAYAIPAADATFDTALCSDVLEHLEEPRDALAETFRVLKPGGYAIYTAPLFWHLHEEPRDFYRFTRHGLRHLFSRCGFEVVEITPLTGFAITFAQELCYALCGLRRGGRWNPLWWLVPPLVQLVQAVGFVLQPIDRSEAFTAEYLVVARRPADDDDVRAVA